MNTKEQNLWNGRCSVLLLAVAILPVLCWARLSDHPYGWTDTLTLDALTRGPAAIVATICLCLAWQLSGQRKLAWLAAIAATVAAQSVVTAGVHVVDAGQDSQPSAWMALWDLLTVAFAAQLGRAAARRSPIGEPVRIGVTLGLALGLARVVSIYWLPEVPAASLGRPLLVLTFGLLMVPTAIAVALQPDQRWAGGLMGGSVLLFAFAHVFMYVAGPASLLTGSVVALGADLVGAVFLSAAAVGLLRVTIAAGNEDRDRLRRHCGDLEAAQRRDRARIHEINATIAGLASASRLLREDTTISLGRRRLMENMICAELGRLQRLLDERSAWKADPPGDVDLDTTIRNLVLAHEARGNRVSWLPSGARVAGEPDAVAEVLNILLDNAAKHARSDTSVTVKTLPEGIEVAVADDGPGVPPELRSRLFEWGARGARSGGQGIGLHIAQDLARRHGGHLTLREDAGHGATFVVRFPQAQRGDDEPAHIA